MKNKEIINILMKSPLYFSLPLFQRLQLTRFIREFHFDPAEINDIFLHSFPQNWAGQQISCKH